MKLSRLLIFAFLLISTAAAAQTQAQKDSLVNEMCKTISATKQMTDSMRLFMAYQKHYFIFLSKYQADIREEIGANIYFRLQRNCKEFKEILTRLDPPKGGDWKAVSRKPKSNLKKKTCRPFTDHQEYTYIEATGDTVNVHIKYGYWIDYFKDGTYSKLKFEWGKGCEFDIEFIESDNLSRKNLSKPGDIYRYQILDKKENYYDMSVEIVGTDRFLTFKMYY